MQNKDFEYLKRKVEILKAVSHPVRLSILRDLLENGPKSAGSLNAGKKIDQALISQHLLPMKKVGIVTNKRKGNERHYRIVDKENLVAMLKVFLYGKSG